jgi:hypothetical protein
MLEHENKFYMAHQAELKEKYPDKWLVIVGESLWGIYDKVSDAGKAALQNFEPGEFMIHRPADDDTVIETGPIISVTQPGEDINEESKSAVTVFNSELVTYQYAH